ncbi:hypothetical protein L209DRAFT_747147 [Thermothelomyces heterothallicus CBS 203.75]
MLAFISLLFVLRTSFIVCSRAMTNPRGAADNGAFPVHFGAAERNTGHCTASFPLFHSIGPPSRARPSPPPASTPRYTSVSGKRQQAGSGWVLFPFGIQRSTPISLPHNGTTTRLAGTVRGRQRKRHRSALQALFCNRFSEFRLERREPRCLRALCSIPSIAAPNHARHTTPNLLSLPR